MKLTSFKCENLGGLAKKEVTFAPGLNVLLGPNEAGKSTIVDGILAVFFRQHRLKKNNTGDKEFAERFRPYPSGDSMKAEVGFEVEGSPYYLSKEWGAAPFLAFTYKEQLLKDEAVVARKLKELLLYGENTYTNVVFARQKDLKEALERINSDEETGQVMGDILRKAIMALDGISLEKLKARLDQEYETLQSRWDSINKRPEGSRGIDNPWKVGVGRVLESYYQKEEIRTRMERARQLEDEYSLAVEKLKALGEKKTKLKEEISIHSSQEDDILKRAVLEPELKFLEKEIQELREVIKEFPVKEAELQRKQEELHSLGRLAESLNQELAVARKIEELGQEKELLTRIKGIEEKINGKIRELQEYPVLGQDQIVKLEDLYNIIQTSRASMEAATLVGTLKKFKGRLFVTRGLEQREAGEVGISFSAPGYLKIEQDDTLELEVRAGQIDFQVLKERYTQASGGFSALLEECRAPDLIEAKKIFSLREHLSKEVDILQKQLKELSKDRDLNLMEKRIKEGEQFKARNIREISESKDELSGKAGDLKAQVLLLNSILDTWKQKYSNPDGVIDLLGEKLKDYNQKKESLARLSPLPQGFISAQDYKNRLASLRKLHEELSEEEKVQQKICYEIENRMPDVSYEELKSQYRLTEEEYLRNLQRLEKVGKIREAFAAKMEEMDRGGALRPLKEAFGRYIKILTLDKYEMGEINGLLEVSILTKDQGRITVKLLSSGTYDCVMLALRFALLDYLFQGREGMVILDDCLVNLDPRRKQQAAALIREYAAKNQIIYTTCDPYTAELLGGNRIALGGGSIG